MEDMTKESHICGPVISVCSRYNHSRPGRGVALSLSEGGQGLMEAP